MKDEKVDQDARKPPRTSARPRPRPQQKADEIPAGGEGGVKRVETQPCSCVDADQKSGSSEPLFFATALRPSRRGTSRMSRTDDLGRALLVELEQLGRLEQLGQRRVAVVARVERGLVADLLADRADARPALSPAAASTALRSRPTSLASCLSLARSARAAACRAPSSRVSSPVSMSTSAGRDRQLVEVQEARAGVDERLGRLLARRSRRPRALGAQVHHQRREVGVRRDDAEGLGPVGVEQVQRIDDHRHVARVLALGVVELLHRPDRVLVQQLLPALQLRSSSSCRRRGGCWSRR